MLFILIHVIGVQILQFDPETVKEDIQFVEAGSLEVTIPKQLFLDSENQIGKYAERIGADGMSKAKHCLAVFQ